MSSIAPDPHRAVKTAKAGLWTVGARLGSKVLDFLALLLLARFLGPADFGLVAMAMTAVFIVEAILELPLGAALIRIETLTQRMFDTAFTLGALRGVIIASALGLAALPLAQFYNETKLVPLICALALAPILRGLMSPRMVIFAKKMDFRRDVILEISGKVLSLSAAVALALATGSYWAIVIGTVGGPLVMTLLSYILAPLRPRLTLKDWPVFADMIGWNMLSQIFSAINWQIDRILLPRFIDVSTFGRYATANDLSAIPYQAIAAPVLRPLLVAYTDARQDGSLTDTYLKSSHAIVWVMAPIFAFMGVMALPLIQLFLGTQWLEAAPMLSGLSWISLIALPVIPLAPLAMSLNRTRLVTLRTFIEFIVKLPLTLVGIFLFGIAGAIAARALASLAVLASSLAAVKTMTAISIRHQLIAVMRPLAGLCPAILFLFAVLPWVQNAPTPLLQLALLAFTGVLYLLITASFSYILWLVCGKPVGAEGFIAKTLRQRLPSPFNALF